MAHFGKVFKFEKAENFEEFLRGTGVPEDKIPALTQHKPSLKWEKDGDGYIFHTITPQGTKVLKFKPGVEVEEQVRDGLKVKITNMVDGNTLTQIIKHNDKTSTMKREFSADKIKTTITAENWNGTAYTYHTAE